MSFTNSRWHYFEEEDSHFALIDGWLFQSVPWNNGNLSPEFWRLDLPSLKCGERASMARIAKKLLRLS